MHARKLDRASVRGYSIAPALTPFTAQGALDVPALHRLLDHILDGGCQGVLAAGTTGEALSMPATQRLELVAAVARRIDRRALLFGGIGDLCFAQSVGLARGFLAAGADAVVAQAPSYFPIGEAELEAWFTSLADAVDGPLFLYNIPQTTRIELPVELIERLSRHPRIAGLKDSSPDADRQERIARLFAGRDDFVFFAGAIPATIRSMQAGADGYVPGAANLAPHATRELMDRIVAGSDPDEMRRAQERVLAVSRTYQQHGSVSKALCGMKTAATLLGLCRPFVLPPLLPHDASETRVVREAMVAAGLLETS